MAAAPPVLFAPGGGPSAAIQTLVAYFQPHRRSIGGIIAEVTIDEQGEDDLQITEHPVEQGAPIADHAFKRPSTLTIRAGWSRQKSGDLSAETGVYGWLLGMQAALLPFNLITGKRNYSNMLIERLQVTTDNHSEYALMATISCRQVILVSTQTTTNTGMSDSANDHANPGGTGPSTDKGDQNASGVGVIDDAGQPSGNPMYDDSGQPEAPPGQPQYDDGNAPPASTPEAKAAWNQFDDNNTVPTSDIPVPTPAENPYVAIPF